MKPRERKWKIAAGVVLPALLGWVCLIFLFVLRTWTRELPSSLLAEVSFGITWLTVLPVSGFAMGVLNVVLWRGLNTKAGENRRWNLCLGLYYLPLLPVLVMSYGLLLLPAYFHVVCYWNGQDYGRKWLDEHLFEEFFDLQPPPESENASSTKL